MTRLIRRLLPLCLVGVCLFLTTGKVFGQECPTASTPSNQLGGFTITPTTGRICVNGTVTINPSPGVVSDGYVYQYAGGPINLGGLTLKPPGQTAPYTAPGSYTILQLTSDSPIRRACRTVEVLAPSPITVTMNSCSNPVSLSYSFTGSQYNLLSINWGTGGGTFPITSKSGSIPLPALTPRTTPYPITVTGQFSGLPSCSSSPVPTSVVVGTGTNNPPNITTLTAQDGDKAIIFYQYTQPPNTRVEVFSRSPGGNFVSTGTVNPSNSFSVVAPAGQTTCYRVDAINTACNTTTQSPEVCTINLKAQAQPGKNQLSWEGYAGAYSTFRYYRLSRNNGPVTGASLLPVSRLSHPDDTNIKCEQYCYVLEAVVQHANFSQTTIRSLSTCVTGIDNGTVAAPVSAFVSVNSGGGIDVISSLSTTAPSPFTLVVERANAFAGPFSSLSTVADGKTYADPTAQINSQSYCYRTAVLNKCKVQSEFTKPACSIFLKVLPDGTLEWTKESPFSNGLPTRFDVFPIDANTGSTLNPSSVSGATYQFKTDPTQNQSTRYYVAAFNAPGDQSYSNTVDVKLAPQFYIPTAFTPNTDVANPTFKVDGYFLNGFEMTLYDRWGNIIFTSNDQKVGWDGTINGEPAPQGAYTYRVKVLDVNDKPFEKAGRVLLLR